MCFSGDEGYFFIVLRYFLYKLLFFKMVLLIWISWIVFFVYMNLIVIGEFWINYLVVNNVIIL